MPSPPPPRNHAFTARARVPVAIGGSFVLHMLVLFALRDVSVLPNVGIELTLPSEAEFGVFEGEPEPPSDPAAPESAPPSAAATPPQPAAAAEPKSQAPIPHEASASKPSREPKPPSPPPPGGALARFAPKGTQISLRLDLDRVREGALAGEVSALLGALPDVRMLLDGSGVDPMHDLSRLFLASPDLRREHVVMAGRYVGDESLPQNAVASLARERGGSAAWRKQRGIAVAPWLNADATPRVLALIGPGLFAITREEDLARVVAVARNLRRTADPQLGDATTQGLVGMARDEVMTLSIENAKSFVRGPRAEQAPDRLEVSVRQRSPEAVDVETHAEFASEERAALACHFWSELRDRYANHALVGLIGMDGVLRDTKIEQRGAQLTAQSSVPLSRARLLLAFARDALGRPRPAN